MNGIYGGINCGNPNSHTSRLRPPITFYQRHLVVVIPNQEVRWLTMRIEHKQLWFQNHRMVEMLPPNQHMEYLKNALCPGQLLY